MRQVSRRVLVAYLLATPLFALLDFGFGWNLRLAGLSGLAGLRLGYYALAFACGLAIWRFPEATAPVAAIESALSLGVLVVAMWNRYFTYLAATTDGEIRQNPFTVSVIVNFILSGSVLAIAMISRMRKAGQPQWGARP